jgi:sugar phosphate isomerase/epimerase
VEFVANAGFNAVDYSLMEMVDPADRYNGQFWKEIALEHGKLLREAGVPVVQTHAPFRFSDFDDPVDWEQVIYPAIVRSIEAAALLGAKVAVVHPLHHYVYAGHAEEIFQRNMDFYRSLIPVCKEFDIKVGIENMFQRDARRGHIVPDTCSTIEEFCRYIDTLDSEYMVACLDVGHIGLPANNIEAWDMIRALGHERLQSLHLHDNDYRDDRHGVPFTGKINWYEVTKALGEINYSGDFTYECNIEGFIGCAESALLPKSLRYMADVGWYLVENVEKNRRK